MDVFTFVCVVTSVGVGASLLTKVVENDREARVAKIEADLKRDLVERLGDAQLVAKVVEAKLSGVGEVGKASGEPSAQHLHVELGAQRGERVANESGDLLDKKDSQGLLLGGLITTLVGIAFFVLCSVDDDFLIPGALCTAVGLALLAFPALRDEMSKSGEEKLQRES